MRHVRHSTRAHPTGGWLDAPVSLHSTGLALLQRSWQVAWLGVVRAGRLLGSAAHRQVYPAGPPQHAVRGRMLAAPWRATWAALRDQLPQQVVWRGWLLGSAAHRVVQLAGPPQQAAQFRVLLEGAALRTVCLASLLLALWTVWQAQTWQTAAGAIQLTGGAVH